MSQAMPSSTEAPRRVQLSRRAASELLLDLERQFKEFRETHKAYTQIPEHLRRAVVHAWQQGVTKNALHRSCGVTPKQLAKWLVLQHESGAWESRGDQGDARARVFKVVDRREDERQQPAPRAEQVLEMRYGPFVVSVRMADESARCCR